MNVTRRLWAIGGLAAVLAVLAVAFARPLLLAGAVLVGAWLLTRQYLFVRALTRTRDGLSVGQTPAETSLRTGSETPVTLHATLETPSNLFIALEGGVPLSGTAEEPLAVSIGPEKTSADVTTTVRWPTAGVHTFDPVTLSASDGLFRETLAVGPTPSVTVEPQSPRNVHVGEGGEQLAMAYGEHDGGRLTSGLDPTEIREYTAGDTADRIDWKATARLGTPHVREYESRTERRTLLVVDHRQRLGAGAPTGTKLEYLREVALSMAGTARKLGDPIGLLTIGDGGITDRLDPSTAPNRYTTIRRTLLDLSATGAERAGDQPSRANAIRRQPSVAAARHSLANLSGEPDAFARTLEPFYAASETYRRRIETDPLYGGVRTVLRDQENVWTVLFTDDADPSEVRETVALARNEGGYVIVCLAPSVLYEPGGLANVEDAYSRYLEFETLRRELASMARVTALEVGPSDRLSTVLAAGRDRRRATAGGRP